MTKTALYRIFYERMRYVGPTDTAMGLESGDIYHVKIGSDENWTPQGLPHVKVRELDDLELVYSDMLTFLENWERS